jgi:hypothetical protein
MRTAFPLDTLSLSLDIFCNSRGEGKSWDNSRRHTLDATLLRHPTMLTTLPWELAQAVALLRHPGNDSASAGLSCLWELLKRYVRKCGVISSSENHAAAVQHRCMGFVYSQHMLTGLKTEADGARHTALCKASRRAHNLLNRGGGKS